MKNNYLIKDHYIIQLENDQLKERIKELKLEIAELKFKLNEKEMPKMQDRKTTNGILS
jgi:ribosomal protein L29